MLHTGLDPPLLAAAEDERVEAKQQMVLQDEQYFYDVVNNPTEIRDNRIEEEWPAGAKPVSKKIQYDDLYRAKRIEYQYTAGDDAWVSPHAADAEGAGDTRRAQPSPHVSFAKRILWQTYQYDWLGNNIQTGDDANGFYDRSLGTVTNGTANDGPYQLRGADIDPVDPNSDALTAEYDVTGNLESMFVRRNATGAACVGGTSCSQSFLYQWDELGRLTHAKRWDGGIQVTSFDTANAAANLEYKYAAGDQRVLKTATDSGNAQVHSVYIYPSLELRRAAFESDDYTRNGATEVAYLFANGVRLARLVNEPLQSDPSPAEVGGLHVFFELGDHLGSTSVALDKATSELVERATYQAYGGAESDYRPERWGSFREDYRFTGKEEDVEVGLTYFGQRFYVAALQRWASVDPLEIHTASTADQNNYAYVSGSPLRNIDPLGLDIGDFVYGMIDSAVAAGDEAIENAQVKAQEAYQEVSKKVDIVAEHVSNGEYLDAVTVVTDTAYDAAAREGSARLETIKSLPAIVEQEVLKTGESIYKALYAENDREAGQQAFGAVVRITSATATLLSPMVGPKVGCFVAGTLVLTERGYVEIQNVRSGDRVLAMPSDGGEGGALEWRQVIAFAKPPSAILDIMLEDDGGARDLVSATLDHPFWVLEKAWVPAGWVQPDDHVWSVERGWLRVLSVHERAQQEVVYNLEVESDHTFFVGHFGVWVHNEKCFAKTANVQTQSGWKETPAGFSDVKPAEVMEHGGKIGHPNTPAGAFDQGVPGQYNASHAEKKALVADPNEPVTISQPMCKDCQRFFSRHAQTTGEPQLTVDPEATRLFNPDGTVEVE